MNGRSVVNFHQIFRKKAVETIDTTEKKFSLPGFCRCTPVEFRSLQTIFGRVVSDCAVFWAKTSQPGGVSDPKIAAIVRNDGGDGGTG